MSSWAYQTSVTAALLVVRHAIRLRHAAPELGQVRSLEIRVRGGKMLFDALK